MTGTLYLTEYYAFTTTTIFSFLFGQEISEFGHWNFVSPQHHMPRTRMTLVEKSSSTMVNARDRLQFIMGIASVSNLDVIKISLSTTGYAFYQM